MRSSSPTVKPRIFVDSAESLERTLYELIPISQAMGIQVEAYDGRTLTLTAPLSANVNHQQSAFGGSLFSVAALAGWGLMQMKLSELLLDCNTVVMGGEVTYQRPVFDDLRCVATLPEDHETFFEKLREEGRNSTTLLATFESDGKTAMVLSGRYHLRQRSSEAT